MADSDIIQGLMQVLPAFEGNIAWLYLDTRGLVTVGIGHMIPNVAWAQQIPFVIRATGAAASAPDIAAGFQAVTAANKGRTPKYYRQFTSFDLLAGWSVEDASGRLESEFLPPLKGQYPGYD